MRQHLWTLIEDKSGVKYQLICFFCFSAFVPASTSREVCDLGLFSLHLFFPFVLSFFCLFFPFVLFHKILFYTFLSFLSFSMSSSFPFIYLKCVLCYLLFLHFLLSLFVILLMFLLLSVCIFSPSVVRSVSFSFTNSFCSVLHRCYKNVFDIFKKSDFFPLNFF